MGIRQTIKKASREIKVTRLAEGARDASGRFVPGGVEAVAIVSLAVQPGVGREATALVRELDGDSTASKIRVWAEASNVAAAYADGDPTKTPIGWAELRVAPAEYAEGPPGDRLVWQGREYELTEEQAWDDAGLIKAKPFRRYIATELGAAP